jgi:hypothetical protein
VEKLMILDQKLLLILVLLFALVLILTILVGILAYKLFRETPSKNSSYHEPGSENSKLTKEKEEAELLDPTLMVCINHSERQAQGICAISQDPICETCLREDDGLVISVDHFRTYLQAQWVAIDKVKATPDDTTASAHIYRLKNRLWANDEVPTLVSTHYKIDIDTDQIESHIHFLVREQEREELKKELEKERSKKLQEPV